MFPYLLVSVVIAPVLLGMLLSRRDGPTALPGLLALVFVYDVLYMFMLYYLRTRWVG